MQPDRSNSEFFLLPCAASSNFYNTRFFTVVSIRPESAAQTQVTGSRFSVTFVNKQGANPIIRSYNAVGMPVRANRKLQHRDCERPSEPSTRHLEIALPSGVTYNAGDHLGIVPRNGLDQIQRVLLRFKLDAGL